MYGSRTVGYLFAAMIGLCIYGAIETGIKAGPGGPIIFGFFAILWLVLLIWNIRQQPKK